jgi:AcrR family transcriptional regulator
MASTRDRIIDAAGELFRVGGYRGTSLSDIGRVARAPTGSIYHAFPGGKSELTGVVVRQQGDSFLELFLAVAAEQPTAADAVGAFFDGAADMLESLDYVDICPIGGVAREVASTDAELASACADVFDSWAAALSRLLASVRRSAGGEPGEEDHLARTVIAALEGGFTLARVQRNGDLLRDIGRTLRPLLD